MKLLLSILLIGILITVSGCVDTNKAKFDTIDANIKSLRQADSDNDAHINDTIKRLDNYATVESVGALDTRLTEHINQPLPDQAALIEQQQRQINTMQADINKLRADLASYKALIDNNTVIPTQTETKLAVSVTKSTDTIDEILEDTETSADFTVKMVNKSAVKLDGIVITGRITCSRDLGMADDYPVLKDSQNGTLLFDYEWDGGNTIDFEFSRSTGSPTVYLNPNETFIFHPQLVLKGDSDYDRTYKFTLEITDYTVGE